jgi:uncharacterized protein (DUF1501 family)
VRCIECEEIELARVSDARPSQLLPMPYAALDGFPAGRSPADLTRRRLLQWGVAGLASVYAAKELGWSEVWESVAEAAEDPPRRCLLLLYLAGGNDGLNTILPYDHGTGTDDYAAYQAARGAIHRVLGDDVEHADGTTTVGSKRLTGFASDYLAFSNPTVAAANGFPYGFDTLYGDDAAGSELAVMPAVDAIKYSLSHFDNSDIWFAGQTAGVKSTGWLGRWIDLHGSPTNPLQAISIDTALSKAIRTAHMPVCAIPSLAALGFTMNGGGYASPGGMASEVDVNAQMERLAAVPAANAYLDRSRATYGVAVETWQDSADARTSYQAGAGYPGGSLTPKLQLAAHLFEKLPTQIITIHWGGFDTHSGQLAGQDAQLKQLSAGLGAFRADLTARGIADRVSTLVFSEFGRRVGENASAGTDHGAGGLMLAMGRLVKGGLASAWPGCKPGDLAGGNLKVPTDFLSVYSTVIAEWLGGDPADVLGTGIAPLARGDALTGTKLFRT